MLTYVIMEVCYNQNNYTGEIKKVKCGLIGLFGDIVTIEEKSKEVIIKEIEQQIIECYTWVDGKKGAKVEVVQGMTEKYIRAEGNMEKRDNVGELPVYQVMRG